MKRLLGILALVLVIPGLIFVWLNLRVSTEPLPHVEDIPGAAYTNAARPWWHSTVVYQIYPRSFQDTDGDGFGDLRGVIQRLDYLAELGVETIWLSPFFESPQRDFGYDVSDFEKVDPVYGDSIVLSQLIDETHRRGMKVVFDLVLNHTSDQHRWFVESRSSRDNAYSDWYVWREGRGSDPPNNWHNALGQRGWHYEETRDQWYYSAFLPFQPDLNYWNPEVRRAMLDLARHWLDRGVDGFRLDIFNFLYEANTFEDNPFSLRFVPDPTITALKFQRRRFTMNRPESFRFAEDLRAVMDEYDPPRFTVGEVFGPHSTLRRFMHDERDGLHSVFLFTISDFDFDAEFFRRQIRTFEAFYPHPLLPTYVFSNHDRPRSITRLGNDAQKAKLLALLQMTVRGIPFVYQGEEIGMHTASISADDALDPLAKDYSPLPALLGKILNLEFNRDNERTPMQWDRSANAGFTDAATTPWLPVQSNYPRINVHRQMADSTSLWNTYRTLLRLRKAEKPLSLGSLDLVNARDLPGGVLAYHRTYGSRRLSVYLNVSDRRQPVHAGGSILYEVGSADESDDGIGLGPYSGVIVLAE